MKGKVIIIFVLLIIMSWNNIFLAFWWDINSLVIVAGGSILFLAINKWALQGRLDFLKDKFSIALGCIYAVCWGIILYVSNQITAWRVLLVPVLYGFIFSLAVSLIFHKAERKK